MSDVESLVVCLPLDEARGLRLRLDSVSRECEVIGSKLSERTCQLKFEWSQTVGLNVVEGVGNRVANKGALVLK